MARSTYTGGTVTEHITVEHTWGSHESHVVVYVVIPGGQPVARLAMPADVMREVGQALIGAADEFDAAEAEAAARADDLAEPDDDMAVARMTLDKVAEEVAEDTDHLGATLAERRVLAALSPTEPRTPAELKRRMPGATPVAVIRSLLESLRLKGLARVQMAPHATGNATPWVSVGAGVSGSEARRQASLEAAKAEVAR